MNKTTYSVTEDLVSVDKMHLKVKNIYPDLKDGSTSISKQSIFEKLLKIYRRYNNV